VTENRFIGQAHHVLISRFENGPGTLIGLGEGWTIKQKAFFQGAFQRLNIRQGRLGLLQLDAPGDRGIWSSCGGTGRNARSGSGKASGFFSRDCHGQRQCLI